jgi:hypothetical protein
MCNQAGQWEGTNERWNALVFQPAAQSTWSAHIYLVQLPANRHEHHGFVDATGARAWCEAEIERLSEGRYRRRTRPAACGAGVNVQSAGAIHSRACCIARRLYLFFTIA